MPTLNLEELGEVRKAKLLSYVSKVEDKLSEKRRRQKEIAEDRGVPVTQAAKDDLFRSFCAEWYRGCPITLSFAEFKSAVGQEGNRRKREKEEAEKIRLAAKNNLTLKPTPSALKKVHSRMRRAKSYGLQLLLSLFAEDPATSHKTTP